MTVGLITVGRVTTSDRFAAARAIADAVLYEGYVLYPYRASSRKNQLRWQFGVLVPPAFSEADGSERCSVCTECLVEPEVASVLTVRIRCLQVQHRRLEAATGPGSSRGCRELQVDGARYVGWDEAVEQVVDLPANTWPGRMTSLTSRRSGGKAGPKSSYCTPVAPWPGGSSASARPSKDGFASPSPGRTVAGRGPR